jgi:hypothetical protein
MVTPVDPQVAPKVSANSKPLPMAEADDAGLGQVRGARAQPGCGRRRSIEHEPYCLLTPCGLQR